MIPVSLRLKNFLSYGTAADTLDFDAFSVACLSGGNGQGKSALLDAVTWAVWGEARKSSDSRKPDDELLRIGARDMEVELVFDLEGTRYRIVRTYHRSASGKTSKPGLEFHVLDPGSESFHPLTAGSVRATQAVIDGRMGIDYDTFINSAFLLQGRSDEFTRKKPGERKEILGKILGLDRYGRYAAAAGQRYSEARERVKRHEAEVERLKNALADEPRWKEECAEAERRAADGAAERERLRAEEAALAERLAGLEERAREAARLREALGRLTERQQKRDAEAETLAGRIAEAEALVGRADALTRTYERHESLLQERNALDEQANLFRGLEKQIAEQRLKLQEERMRLEGRLDRLRDAVASDKQRLDEDDRRLQERPRVLEQIAAAEADEREYHHLQKVEAERKAIEQRIAQLETRLSHAGGHLKGELNTLRKQVADAMAAVVPIDTLRKEEARLAASCARIETWQREQEAVREDGTSVKEQLAAAEADRRRLAESIADLEDRRARIRTMDAETCPTCGTPLTDAHRRHVAETYKQEQEQLRGREAALSERIQALEAERDGLRKRFVALRTQIEETNGVATRLVQVRERLERHDEEQAALQQRREQADEIERTLREESFEPQARAERTELQERLAATPLDEDRYATVHESAARLPALREKREELDAISARRDDLAQRVRRQEEEAARLRADLDAGETLAPIRRQLDALTARRDGLGYDGARHEAVTRELQGLAEAPKQFTRLMEAQRNLTEWVKRQAQLEQEGTALREEQNAQEEALRRAEAVLSDRPEAVRKHAETAAAREKAEQRLSEAQSHLGALRERLARCAEDRERLRSVRAAHREAKGEAALYRHLRGAFGKHGIPSLIIEETLPEIEDRANALLERLSNGRTRVALETLADKKAGGTKETLDIRITDDQGVARPYETYSGGEAFRVNFALRIALSQLLAERAGIRIRTLVVDEGFGTQDKQGIQNLVEAIRTIQDDFDKILVITHLDELKDAFPIRIEVTKRPVEGSTFEMMGV